jgi:lipid-A-disaccharide synthase
MGFTEVIRNLPIILRNIKFCKSDILQFKPDVIVFIDYPGFNLRIAAWAHQRISDGILLHHRCGPGKKAG